MSSWQKRARLGVATFAVGFAAVVYLAMGERQAAAPAPPVERRDPKASLEVESGVVSRYSGIEQEFEISAESQLTYPDGSVQMKGVRIDARKRDGRDFTITAQDAKAGPDRKVFELSGQVVLTASDGFGLKTENATHNHDEGVVRAPGAVTFSKGRMSGSGVGMTYDERNDILTITDDSVVTMTDEAGAVAMMFEAGASTLQRIQSILTLEGGVHVLRAGQEIDGDRVTAYLSEKQEFVTFVELRGNARVAGGGGSLDSMSSRDIDLDYSDDGQTLDRVVMAGGAAVAVTGSNGRAGREIFGDSLELTLAPDGSVTKATGRDGVRLTLPADDDTPARSITARALEGDGQPGEGLTSMQFDGMVEYRESSSTAVSREAHSQRLRVALAEDRVTDALFTGRARFQDRELEARAAEARYSPAKGTLHLAGTDAGGGPRVSDEQITIEATDIDLAFDTRQMQATGNVKTTLHPRPPKPADRRAAREERGSKMPGLLQAEQAVTVNAGALDYGGGSGRAVYKGGALLTQGDTLIRGTTITIDQDTGNLTAAGAARSSLLVDSEVSEGTADEIRYDDTKRLIVYSKTAPGVARVKGPQGDLRAGHIEITLEPEASRVTRLDARTSVSIDLGTRTATGVRLEYRTAEGRYTMHGAAGKPVSVSDRAPDSCRQLTGMKLIFFKSTDNIVIDGEEKVRTKAGSGGPCTQPPLAPSR